MARFELDSVVVRRGNGGPGAVRDVLGPLTATLDTGVVGVVGPNGAGKSTLLRVLAGLLRPTHGHARLDGRSAVDRPRAEVARAVAYVPQSTSFELAFPVVEVVRMGRFARGDMHAASGDAAVRRAVTRLGLEGLVDRPVTTLSGGERQRVALARAVASEAPIWLLDEPAAALDLRHAFDVFRLAREHAARGLVVMAHHDINAVRRYTDRVLLLEGGRLVADGPPGSALTPERVAAVFGVAVRETPDGWLVFDAAR